MSIDAREHRRSRIPGKIDPKALGSWLPTNIAGCQLWLDANQIVGLNDGDPVALWEDQSGQGNDATQADAAKKPTYETNELNGKPVVRFDGSDDLVITGLNIGNVGSLVFVLVPTPANPRGILDSAPGAANTLRNFADGQFEWWNANPQFNLGLAAVTAVLVEFLYTNNPARNVDYYRDGALISNNPGAGADVAAWNNPRLGSINLGGNGWYTGDMAEIVFYNIVLSAGERASLEAYLNAKYAIF